MVKMVSLKRTKAEREEDEHAMGEVQPNSHAEDGMDLHLQRHHLDKLEIPHDLPHGHEIELRMKGHVHRTDNGDGPEGEHAHMHVKVTHAHAEFEHTKDGEREREGLREELEKNTEEAETRRAEKAERPSLKKAAAGKKEPEHAGGGEY